MKNLRLLAALFLAFGSLFFVTPAHAQTLEEAQAALAAGQQELLLATQALSDANAALTSASATLTVARAAYEDPSNSSTVASTVQTATQQVVQNGEFNSTTGWSNVVASSSVYGTGASPLIYNGTLKGSYTSGIYIQQTGNFPAPTRQVTFSVDVWNYDTNEGNRVNSPDYYRIEFRTYAADGSRLNYYNLEVNQWHNNWITRGGTFTLSQDAVRWDIGFRMADGGFWAGAFGPTMDNVRLFATMTTGTPERTVVNAEVETAYNSALAAYNSAVATKAAAQTRYDAAVAAIPGLEAAVTALTPPWWQVQFNENDHVVIGAPTGFVFGVPTAWYGDPRGTCGVDVSAIVRPLVEGLSPATFAANNELFTDPCPGTVKVLRMRTPVVAAVTVPPVVETPSESPSPQPTEPQPLPEPSSSPSVDPTPAPSPSPTESPSPTTPPVEPSPEPSPSPAPSPEPQPTPTPEPETSPSPAPSPEITPSPSPSVDPSPEPTVEPEPVPVDPSPEVPAEPEPPVAPEPQPEPEVTPEPEPAVIPEEPVVEPVVPEEPVAPEPPSEVVADLLSVPVDELTTEQVETLVAAAMETFETAEQGSPEYQAALEALAVAADADDPEIPAELAAIPLVGEALGAALEVFNDLGNVGADMAPEVREAAEKVVVSAIIVTQVATSAAVSAAVASASSVSTRKIN